MIHLLAFRTLFSLCSAFGALTTFIRTTSGTCLLDALSITSLIIHPIGLLEQPIITDVFLERLLTLIAAGGLKDHGIHSCLSPIVIVVINYFRSLTYLL